MDDWKKNVTDELSRIHVTMDHHMRIQQDKALRIDQYITNIVEGRLERLEEFVNHGLGPRVEKIEEHLRDEVTPAIETIKEVISDTRNTMDAFALDVRVNLEECKLMEASVKTLEGHTKAAIEQAVQLYKDEYLRMGREIADIRAACLPTVGAPGAFRVGGGLGGGDGGGAAGPSLGAASLGAPAPGLDSNSVAQKLMLHESMIQSLSEIVRGVPGGFGAGGAGGSGGCAHGAHPEGHP